MNSQQNSETEQPDIVPHAYIAGIGMITPTGFNTASTCAAINAGISTYKQSEYFTREQKPVKLSCVPQAVFQEMKDEVDEGEFYSGHLDHVIRMSIIGVNEALQNYTSDKKIPFILALQESHPNITPVNTETLMANLTEQYHYPIDPNKTHFLNTGRASGLLGIELGLRYLTENQEDYVLLGGVDSYVNTSHVGVLDRANRLNVENSKDGFVPGEGAGFLLLTRHAHLAMTQNNVIVRVNAPGTGHEPGHLNSEQPYLGEGLDQAVKRALKLTAQQSISQIYSSMNGENFWAKEYGVMSLRNKAYFDPAVKHHHPAQNYGDLGAATGTVLLGVAAHGLLKQGKLTNQLIYASSDSAWRAAVCLSSVNLATERNKQSS